MLTLAELFSGIGGWSEAAKMAGDIDVIWHSENDKNKIINYEKNHTAPNYGDIRTIRNPPYADIFTVSFPCTGISSAGLGRGLEDPGSRLWFEAERLIGDVRPRYVAIENSPNLTFRGLSDVLRALAQFGYYAEWTHLSGTQFGFQQRRKRLYLIANTDESRFEGLRRSSVLFRKLEAGKGNNLLPVYPGWRERSDIPQPRTFFATDGVPGLVSRLEGAGDAIIPHIGMYVLECIKRHNETLKTH